MICTQLAIPFDVAGVTLLAFGNGAPDLFSSLATSTSGKMETGLNALLGGVMFVTTVVVGASLHASPTSCVKITPRPFCRDVLALLLTLVVLFIDLPSSATTRTSAYLLLGCYIVYVAVVLVPSWCSKHKSTADTPSSPVDTQGVLFAFWHAPDLFPPPHSAHAYGFVTLPDHPPGFHGVTKVSQHPSSLFHVDDTYFPVPTSSELSDPLLQTSTSPLSPDTSSTAPLVAPVATVAQPSRMLAHHPSASCRWRLTTVQYILLELVRDATIPMVFVTTWSRRSAFLSLLVAPLFVGWIVAGDAFTPDPACITLAISFPLACLVFASSYSTSPPSSVYVRGLFYLLGFTSCVCWIYGLASEVVAVLATFGSITKLPPSVIGLTVLSWGNSLGDLSTNVAIARTGCAEMALAGCFGGPVFNLLVGLGIPFLCAKGTNGGAVPIDVHGLVSLASLALSLVLTLAVALVYRFQCPKWYASVLYGVYAVYTMAHVAILMRWVDLDTATLSMGGL
ncbi:hypothetical protein, variant 1 [Aphanomyces invadans]|nr:hypothetical protein, variant 1 [Aphanomyces invadans]ETW07029.1 hypothetical protein, variant 1 [Aphanomyces invadans]|eukprot:XP_008865104.1 hypothetical protein, variant 1 [Aphanomyces invadans]